MRCERGRRARGVILMLMVVLTVLVMILLIMMETDLILPRFMKSHHAWQKNSHVVPLKSVSLHHRSFFNSVPSTSEDEVKAYTCGLELCWQNLIALSKTEGCGSPLLCESGLSGCSKNKSRWDFYLQCDCLKLSEWVEMSG